MLILVISCSKIEKQKFKLKTDNYLIVIKMKEAERQKLQVLRLPYTTAFEMIIWVLPQSSIAGILHTFINTPIINENSVYKISSQPGEYNNSPMFHKKSISIQVTTTIRIVITVS